MDYELFLIKSITMLFIGIIAFLSALIPLFLKQNTYTHKFIFYGDYFSKGVFLGVALIHLLPTASDQFSELYPHITFPVILTITAVTVFIMQFLEHMLHSVKYSSLQSSFSPYLLLIILSIHSIVAGAALGISNNLAHMMIIFFAILAHKGIESFALSINLRKNSLLTQQNLLLMIFIFSSITPLGILMGSLLNNVLTTEPAQNAQTFFIAFSAGVFIYIAAFNSNQLVKEPLKNKHTLFSIFSFGLGIISMGLVAAWL